MSNSFYSKVEVQQLGFKTVGNNVLISKKTSLYGIEKITIGNNVRIDDFCILSGAISIGNYVHISAFVALYGSKGIKIGNYSGISPNSIIFSAVDDFSGEYFINPMIPSEFTNVKGGLVKLNDYVQLGVNTVVMPNITIGNGTVTGAFSFINKNLDDWSVYYGIPVKKIGKRKSTFLKNLKKITN